MYWSYILTAVGVTGLLVMGSGKRWGWLIGLGAQVLWIAYALATQQYGFLISAAFYGGAYIRGYLKNRKKNPSEIEIARQEAYISGLSNAGSVIRIHGQDEGLKRVIGAIDEETTRLNDVLHTR